MLPKRLHRLKRLPKLGQWLNELWDHVATLTPMASHNVRVNRTTRGFSLVGVPKTEEVEGKFRGEWDASFGTGYSPQDIVKISSGLEAGTYVAVESIAAGDQTREPWGNNGWVLIARLNDQSSWV
jgi:hypothetical protein